MFAKSKIILISLFSALLMFSGLATPVYADVASNKDAACQGVAIAGGSCDSTATGGVESIVKTVITLLSWIVGVASVIVIIIAGLLFVLSAGDPQKAAKARQAILYAIIGLVIVALAQVIVRFVIGTIQ